MKKYIKASNDLYNLTEIIQDSDDFLQALGFTNLDGSLYAGTIGTGLVLYSLDDNQYTFIRNGAAQTDEILTGLLSGSDLKELTKELNLTYQEYKTFEEI